MADGKSKTRNTRTPAERAQSDYEVADRKVTRATEKVKKAKADLAAAEKELSDATTQRNAYKNLADALGAGGQDAVATPAAPEVAEDQEVADA